MGENGKRNRQQRDHGDRGGRNGDNKNQKRRVNDRDERDKGELIAYRILCPNEVIGSVIGKNGKVINSIRQESRAKVKVVDPFPGAKHRVITIFCHVKDKKEIEIEDEFDNEKPLCAAQDALIKVHSAISNSIETAGDSEKKRKNKDECQILVPSSQSAILIGKAGATIKQLRVKTRTNIKVVPKDAADPEHSCAMEFDNFVLITGESEAVKRALFAVSTIMYKFSPKEDIPLDTTVPETPHSIIIPSELPIYPPGGLYPASDPIIQPRSFPQLIGATTMQDLHGGYVDTGNTWPLYSSPLPVVSSLGASQSEELIVRMLCPSDKIGQLIGKGGGTIKRMRQASGARIEVDDSKARHDECLITITATESSSDLKSVAVEAVLLLQEKINDEDDAPVSIRLLVPSKVIGCIIGRSGAIINEIRKRTKADIQISRSNKPKYADDNDELVEVVGEVDCVRDALIQIVLRLREDVLKNKDIDHNRHIGSDLLNEWEEQNDLQRFLDVIDMLLTLPSDIPLAKAFSGLQFLLHKAQVMQENHSKFTFSNQLKSVFDLMSSWQKMELGSWPVLLDEVMDQYENNAKKLWFPLYSLLLSTTSDQSIFQSLEDFIQTSSFGEFRKRLQLLYAFLGQNHTSACLKINSSCCRTEQSTFLYNMFGFYVQFLPTVSKHIDASRKEISTELKDLVKLCRWEQDKSYSSIENLKKSRQKLKKLIKKHTDILQEPMDKLIRDVLHKGSISGVSDLPLFSDENRLMWFENCSMALDTAFENLLLKKTSAFDVLLVQQKNAEEVGSILRSCDSQRTLYQEGWKDVWHMIENIYIKAVDSGNIWKEDKNNQRKSRALSDLLNLFKTSGLSQRKSTHKDERKPWWFLQLSGNMECLLLENSRFASPSLEIDGKVKNKDAPEESPLTEWKTAIEHYFKSVMCVRLLQEEICLDPHKDIAPQQVARSRSFLSQLVQIQQDQLAAASAFSAKLKCFREFATTMGKLFSFSSPTDNSKSYMCSIVPPNQLATYKCMWQQKQLFDSLCATSNGELLLLRILENSHLNTCQRTRPSVSEMTASIEEFLPVFCKSKESLDCYLIGGSKAVTTIASSHLFVVTQEMEQLVSENFKAIKDFKDHFLVLKANGIDRSSVKNVLIHHFQEIIDKAKSIEEEFITAKNENSNPVDSSEKAHFCERQCAEPNARFDEALKSTYQHITSVLQSLCSPITIPSMINLGSWELQFVANLSLDMLCDDLFKTITFGAKLVNCCDNNISSSSKVGAHFQNLHTLVDLLLKFSDELLKNFFAMHKSVAVTTHVIANILVSLFSKGFGRLTENQEDDGTLDKSEDASGTGMGEGVGLNDVSDQITDEDQLLGTREQKKEEQEESKDVPGSNNTGIEMDQDFQADAVSLSEESSENEDCDGENEELESEMGPTGPDSEAVEEKIWDQNEDETPNDTGEKYESGPSVKDGDGSNKELRAKDDSTSDQSGDDSCDEGDAQNDEAAAQNEFDDEENGEDVNMDKEAAHSDATGLKPDEPDHSSDMEIDLNANEDADPIEEGDQEGHDDSAENGNQEDGTCPPDEIMEEAHTEVDVSSEKDDLGQEHQENDDMNSMDPKNDTSESSDVVNPQVSNVDLASQSKSNLQTSGSENIASESNLSNSNHDFGNPAVTGGFPSSDMSEMDINMSDSSNTGGFSKTQPKSHLPQHEHSFSQEKQTNPSRSTGDALDFRKERINLSGDLPEDNMEHLGEMDDDNVDEYGYVSEFEKGTTQALGPATLEQVDRNIDVDKVDTESRAGEDANLQLEKQNSEIDSVSNSSLLPKNEKRDQANMPVIEKSQDDGSVKPLGSANIDPESRLEDLISISRSYLGENTQKLSQLSVNDEELGKYHEPCDAPDHVKDNATALWRRYELSTTKLSQELTEQLRLVLEPTVASKLQGYYKTGKRIHMKKVIQFIASFYRMDKIWLRRTRPNKRDYQVVIAVDDSHSMSESCCGDVAVEALVTVCRAVSQLEMGSLAVASFGTKGNINLLHDFDSPFTAEAGVKMVSNLTFKQENTIADEPVVDLLKFLTNKLDAAVVKARLPSGHNPLQQLVLIIADGRFHEKDNLKRCVREALASNRMVAFLLLDNSQESIMDLMEASFEGGKMKFSKYMDSFPFPYYIVLRNIEALPRTLANLLRQWLELMQHSNY